MCGIAGALLKKHESIFRDELLRRGRLMTEILRHRGPDGADVWADEHVVLAHTRLAVVDVTSAAAQPMHDDTGTIHVVFNGEIYNFRELRGQLQAAGYRFRSSGDTEVLVNGYRHWGTDLFSKLVGMFAIAFWDSHRRRLVLVRDRFGEKPLYYSVSGDALVFASEAKGLLTWPGMRRQADMAAIHDYLTFGFTLGGTTAFSGIERLQPAHYMVCEAGKPPEIHRYWRMPLPGSGVGLGSTEDLKAELIERLRAAVKSCLIADVPLGAFLSGGVDSSAVVALMSASHGAGIKTFSSGFGFGDYDETRFGAIVADRYQTHHQIFTFDSGVLKNTAALAWYYGEPFSDSSALVTYALSREVRRSVTVALTGDGADETLLGYSRYFTYGDMRRSRPPRGARRVGELYATPYSSRSEEGRVAASDAYGYLLERFREGQKLEGYGLAMLPYLGDCSYERLLPYVEEVEPEEAAARFDQATYLPDDLLVKVDVAAMAHGLETRAPFLNHELAEWIAGLPPQRKAWDREGKALLKAALEPLVPHECMYRTKVGFRVPVAKFMIEEARDQIDAVLLGERFLDRKLIRPDFVRQMLTEHQERKVEHGTRLWTLICLEMWYRTWLDSDSNEPLASADDPFAALGAEGKASHRQASNAASASVRTDGLMTRNDLQETSAK